MTLETWKQEFYPSAPTKTMRKRTAIEHSLRKWRGLTKANLRKHEIYKIWNSGKLCHGYDVFRIDSETCSLCVKYLNIDTDFGEECAKCPLYKLLGHPCDHGSADPYQVWIDTGNPRKMIKALEKLLEE